MDTLSLTALRKQLFKVVDEIIATGIPVEIERRGHKLRLCLDHPLTSVTKNLQDNALNNVINDLDSETEWEWNELDNL